MTYKFEYPTYLYSQGRNGLTQAKGLQISEGSRLHKDSTHSPIIIFTPINSKGGLSQCSIEIHKDCLGDLINILINIKDDNKRT